MKTTASGPSNSTQPTCSGQSPALSGSAPGSQLGCGGGPVVKAGRDLPHATSFSISRFERLLGILTQARVHGRGLDHRARRRHEPVEALGLLELRDRPGVRVAGGDPRHRVEVRAHLGRVEAGGEGRQARLVERGARREVAARAAEEHDADVHALAALDARDDAHDRVLEGLRTRARRPPPPRSAAAAPAARSGTRRYRSRVRPLGRARATTARAAPPASAAPRAARRPRAIEPAHGSSTWSAIAGNGFAASASGSQSRWWKYSAAPWSISHTRSCQTSRFGLRGVRSTLVTSASSHTISAAVSGAGWSPAAGV